MNIANKINYVIEDCMRAFVKDETHPAGIIPYEEMAAAGIYANTKNLERMVLRKITALLDMIDPDDALSVEKKTKEILALIEAFGIATAPVSADEVFKTSDRFYRKVKKLLSVKFNIPYSFGFIDEVAIERVNTFQNIFIRNHYKDEVTEQVRKFIMDTIKEREALDRKYIAEKLKSKMPGYIRQKGYYKIVAGQVLNNARSYSNLVFYDDARILRFEVLAIMDQRTTQQCRFMDGRVLEVRRALERYKLYDDARTIDEVKEVNPWIGVSGGMLKVNDTYLHESMTGADLQGLGVNAPPYHGNCRTTVVPVF